METSKKEKIKAHIVALLKEPSTWRGFVLIATAAGCYLEPEQQEAIITGGLLLAGVIGAGFSDKK